MLPLGDSKSNSGKVLEKLSKLSKPSFGILSIIYAASLRSIFGKIDANKYVSFWSRVLMLIDIFEAIGKAQKLSS